MSAQIGRGAWAKKIDQNFVTEQMEQRSYEVMMKGCGSLKTERELLCSLKTQTEREMPDSLKTKC